jgi:hypothetical protein
MASGEWVEIDPHGWGAGGGGRQDGWTGGRREGEGRRRLESCEARNFCN